MFSTIDHAKNGHERLLKILHHYGLVLDDDEINLIKYVHLPDRYNHYIRKVSKKEQRDFKKLMSNEQHYIYTHSYTKGGRKKVSKTPTFQFNRPDKILLKFGKKKYEFSKDDFVRELFTKHLQPLFLDYSNQRINFVDHKVHDFKELVLSLFEFLKEIIADKKVSLSENKILHLTYDLMALSNPLEFISNLNYEHEEDSNRYKAARIKSIIK